MSIPLDRLYHYIEDVAEDVYRDNVVIYRFYPHGSKKVEDLRSLTNQSWKSRMVLPSIICHDQEPLSKEIFQPSFMPQSDLFVQVALKENIRSKAIFDQGVNIYNKHLLVHSEQRSELVEVYSQQHFLPVYYWSHAVIARDWFRFAEHVNFKKQPSKTFLIYNRAWSGTREYRLKFANTLIGLGLENNCKMSINPIEPELGIHYELHNFSNPVWRPTKVLENYFAASDAHSHYSADFDATDYNVTDIEVVLETLFDDSRLHLTEKSLRPIACNQPFILAGTQGSLEYLRSYGFKTFEHIWDERYDSIEDPEERLSAITDLMKQITAWLPHQRESKMAEACVIADYNRQHFFSQAFFDQVCQELSTNLMEAFTHLGENYDAFTARWNVLFNIPSIETFLKSNTSKLVPNWDDAIAILDEINSNKNK
jgi:hypothetical protein